MNTKQEIIKFIEELPNSATLEDIMEELYFRQKVDKGLEDIEKGRLISPSTTFDNFSRNKARFINKEQGHCWPCSK